QMRAMGTGALARGELAPETRGQLRALRARADEFDAASQASLQRAAQHAPGLTATLGEPLAAEKARVAEALRLVDDGLLEAASLQLPAARYFDTLTASIEAVNALGGQATDALLAV